jgi:ubiquinone/menaquinone biosynthesis C-methylase UbiE
VSGLAYDGDASARLKRAYTTADVQEQRDAVRRALRARAGERILDLGSGPGILACEIATEVGPKGTVTAVDISPDMNAIASRRATEAGLVDRIEIVQGDAGKLVFPDGSFDGAVSTQVVEYVDDVDAVLMELRRLLRPGGRLVLLDTDWDTLVWSARDEALMGQVLDAWRSHAPHMRLPRTLGLQLRACGFEVDQIFVLTLLNTEYNESTYSYNLAGLIADFVRAADLTEAEVDAWLAELASHDRDGAYFFSLNRYGFAATAAA